MSAVHSSLLVFVVTRLLICCLWGIMTEADLKGCIRYPLLCHKLPPTEQLSDTGVFSRLPPWVRSLCLAGCLAQRLPGCSQGVGRVGIPSEAQQGKDLLPSVCGCWQDSAPVGCRVEASIFQRIVSQTQPRLSAMGPLFVHQRQQGRDASSPANITEVACLTFSPFSGLEAGQRSHTRRQRGGQEGVSTRRWGSLDVLEPLSVLRCFLSGGHP